MKHILIITLAFLLSTTLLFAQVQESGVLYLWEISEEKIWKSFGDDETQHKYKGEIKDGKPDGLGIRLFLDGKKYMGQWQAGQKHACRNYLFLFNGLTSFPFCGRPYGICLHRGDRKRRRCFRSR